MNRKALDEKRWRRKGALLKIGFSLYKSRVIPRLEVELDDKLLCYIASVGCGTWNS